MTPDDVALPELTRRQEEILALIVRTYTHSPEPISSKYLSETDNLGVSSATIRNEMAVLEEKGYIYAPHTSAGRVPTENGYRYFVKSLLYGGDLSAIDQTRISEKLQALPMATEQWMRLAATTLARTAQSAALVTPPVAETTRFKHVELISVQGRLVLMVLVMDGGNVHQQMLNLDDSIAQPMLSEIAQRLNTLCVGLNANEVRMKGVQLLLVEREVAELIADLMEKADLNQVHFIYRDGLSEIISTFQSGEGAQQVVRVFEERAFLNMIINEVLNNPVSNNVHVVIAGDGRWEELKYLTMVLSRYGVRGQISGAVGVVGPTHINYGRAISTVRHVSHVMTDMLANLYERPQDSAAEEDDQGKKFGG